jgi:predicted PurR-regulated permease PerM
MMTRVPRRKHPVEWIGWAILGIASVPLAFWGMDKLFSPYLQFISRNVFDPLGVNKWPEPLSLSFSAFVSCGPLLLIVWLVAWKAGRSGTNVTDKLRQQFRHLDEAQSSITASLEALSELKAEIATNMVKHEELRALVDRLESTAGETTDSLRQKLSAIETVNRNKELARSLIAFVSGVLASLAASAIWQAFASH